MSMKPTIVFITQVTPCPPYGGQSINIYNLIESLVEHANVIMLTTKPAEPACALTPKIMAWYTLPTYSIAWWAKLINFRAVLAPRASWRARIQTVCRQHQPLAVWFSHGHWGQYVPPLRRQGIRTVMCTHNIESHLTRLWATNTPWGRQYLVTRLRAWAEKQHEERLFQTFDYIVSVSEEDRRYHAQFVGEERSILIPNYINEALFQPVEAPKKRADNLLIMTGSFQNFQNRQAILWFLANVWPQIRAQCPKTQLQLVGTGVETLPDHVHQAVGVECVGEVPSVTPYLRHATVAIVPLLHGSGTRLKILEAWASNLPIVSTTLGAAGLAHGVDSIVLADDASAFAQAVIKVLQDAHWRARLAQHGLQVLRANYTTQVNTARLQQVVAQLSDMPTGVATAR